VCCSVSVLQSECVVVSVCVAAECVCAQGTSEGVCCSVCCSKSLLQSECVAVSVCVAAECVCAQGTSEGVLLLRMNDTHCNNTQSTRTATAHKAHALQQHINKTHALQQHIKHTCLHCVNIHHTATLQHTATHSYRNTH